MTRTDNLLMVAFIGIAGLNLAAGLFGEFGPVSVRWIGVVVSWAGLFAQFTLLAFLLWKWKREREWKRHKTP